MLESKEKEVADSAADVPVEDGPSSVHAQNDVGNDASSACPENVAQPGECTAGSGEAPCDESAPGPSAVGSDTEQHPDLKASVALAGGSAEAKGNSDIAGSGEAPCDERVPEVSAVCPDAEQVGNLEVNVQAGSSGEAPCNEIAPEANAGGPEAEQVGNLEGNLQAGSSGEAPCDEIAPEATAGGPDADHVGNLEGKLQAGSSGEAPCAEIVSEANLVSPDAEQAGNLEGNLQAGSSGEAPCAEIVPEANVVSPDAEQVACSSADLRDNIWGDYQWTSEDGNLQCFLRVQESGQWHHSAHRTSKERGRIVDPKKKRTKKPEHVDVRKAYKNFDYEEKVPDLRDLEGDYQEFQVWELAEATGSWREVQVICASSAEDGAPVHPASGLMLTCECCNWKTNFPSAPLVFRPDAGMREEIDAMFESRQLVMCFKARQCEQTGCKLLELHMDLSTVCEWTGAQVESLPRHVHVRSLQTSFQTLGFTRSYQQVDHKRSEVSQVD